MLSEWVLPSTTCGDSTFTGIDKDVAQVDDLRLLRPCRYESNHRRPSVCGTNGTQTLPGRYAIVPRSLRELLVDARKQLFRKIVSQRDQFAVAMNRAL